MITVSLIHRSGPDPWSLRVLLSFRSRRRFRLVVAMVVAGSLVSACTSAPVDLGPRTSSASPAVETTSVPQSPPVATLAPGTVVPFRTVAAGSSVGKRIGLISSAGSDPFGKAITDSIVTQVNAAGADMIRCDPGADESLVLDCARRMATQKVDGWIVQQPGNLGPALCAAGPPGVPLITVAAAPVSCQSASIGADDRQAGLLVGQALGQVSRSRSHCVPDAVIIFGNSETGTVSARRVEGINAGYTASCPGVIRNERIVDAGTQDLSYAAFTSAITSLPDDAEILVAAVNDGAALGVAAAIPDTRAGHVWLAGIGGDQRARCEIRADAGWIGDAALFPDRYGEVAVPALLDAMQGITFPRIVYVPTTFVRAATMAHFYDVADCPGS